MASLPRSVPCAPRLADKAGTLCVEHRELLREANELCRFAEAGSPSVQWWRELNSRATNSISV